MYMYDCIILDGRGCDVTIAMCNNKTLTPEKKKKKKKKKRNLGAFVFYATRIRTHYAENMTSENE